MADEQTDPYDGTGIVMTTGEAAANAPADEPQDKDAAEAAEAAAQGASEEAIEEGRADLAGGRRADGTN